VLRVVAHSAAPGANRTECLVNRKELQTKEESVKHPMPRRSTSRRVLLILALSLATVAGGFLTTAAPARAAVLPPTTTKLFGAGSIPVGGTTLLTVSINNPNAATTLTNVGFIDALPPGLVVSTPITVGNTCGGFVVAFSGVIILVGATLAPFELCLVLVLVTGTQEGVAVNTVAATSTEGGIGLPSSAAILVTAGPPIISKSFSPLTIAVGGTSTLTFTISNPNNLTTLTLVGFTDTLNGGLVVSTPNGLTNTCGGIPTATPGTTSISLSGGTIAAGGSCTLTVNVTGTATGVIPNTTSAVTSFEGGPGNTASATITVASAPVIAKAFSPSSIPLGGTSTLSLTITNPNSNVGLTGVAFTDTLPSGLVDSTPQVITNSCGGGSTVIATSGTSTISLSGGTIAAGGSCTVTVHVTGTTAGVFTNTTGTVTSSQGTGNAASATLTVVAPPSITKAFGAAAIAPGGTTSLTLTITNPNTAVALTGVAFTDTLPSGLVVASPNGLSNTCGGAVTATPGSSTISLSGGTIAAGGSCTLTVNVTGTATGTLSNCVPVSSTNGGTGNTSCTSITVAFPPQIAKNFAVAAIGVGYPVNLKFTITNPNSNVTLTGVSFIDVLPGGMMVTSPTLFSACGGTVFESFGAIFFFGGTLSAGSSCSFSVYVTGTSFGLKLNVTSPITAANAPPGNQAYAQIWI
jgi:uncharacterized repeat protein (TIGR01451 family)